MVVRLRLALSLVALAVTCGPAPAPASVSPLTAGMTRPTALASQVAAELNAARAKHGLHVLRISPGLAAAAESHSHEMARHGYFEHRSADGSAFWKRVARFYPSDRSRVWSVGENLLWSSPGIDAPGALRMWMASAEHRKNMLDGRWREIGISALHVPAAPGFFSGREVTILTADFGLRS
jgi:uncharacterized protein YkwD